MNGWAKKRQVMRRYDVTADIYDMRYAEEQAAKIETALKHVEINGKSNTLDIGCGTGLLFSYIAAEAETVVGLDVSRKSLLVAKNRAKSFQNVSLVLADADNIPIRENVFSHAFAFTLVQNMPNPVRTLNEIKRVAKDDAVWVLTGLKRVFSKEAFNALLQKAGLSVSAFEDQENLKCYVAVGTLHNH